MPILSDLQKKNYLVYNINFISINSSHYQEKQDIYLLPGESSPFIDFSRSNIKYRFYESIFVGDALILRVRGILEFYF